MKFIALALILCSSVFADAFTYRDTIETQDTSASSVYKRSRIWAATRYRRYGNGSSFKYDSPMHNYQTKREN